MKLHLDFDSFFASCERARRAELAQTPLAVYAGDEINPMVLAATYDAKRCGVYTTQRIYEAKMLCANLALIKCDKRYYQAISQQAKEFFAMQIPVIEQYSIDEFFGDLAGFIKDEASALRFAKSLQELTKERFNLDISIGISKSKWSAKLLTTLAKPCGVLVALDIKPHLNGVDIAKFPGIGKVLANKLKAHGVATLDAALAHPELFKSHLERKIYARIAGCDDEAVVANAPTKSMGASRAFRAHRDYSKLLLCAAELADELNYNLLKAKKNPSTLSLAYKGAKGAKSYSIKLSIPLNFAEIRQAARNLVDTAMPFAPIYYLGLNASGFNSVQMDLFNTEKILRQERLNKLLSAHPELVKLRSINENSSDNL